MENDNYKPNRYTRRHPAAAARAVATSIANGFTDAIAMALRSPLVISPIMYAVPEKEHKPSFIHNRMQKYGERMLQEVEATIKDAGEKFPKMLGELENFKIEDCRYLIEEYKKHCCELDERKQLAWKLIHDASTLRAKHFQNWTAITAAVILAAVAIGTSC